MEIDCMCFNCKGRKEAPRDGCTRTWHTANRGPTQQYRRLWEAEDPEDINEQEEVHAFLEQVARFKEEDPELWYLSGIGSASDFESPPQESHN